MNDHLIPQLVPALDAKGRQHGIFAAPPNGIAVTTPRGTVYRQIRPGEQALRIDQPIRPATCEEVGCEWFILGKEGQDEGKPFTHPAGVPCGDFSRCLPCSHPEQIRKASGGFRKKPCGGCPPCLSGTANCPCPARKHRRPVDEDIVPPKHRMSVQGSTREVVGDEWKYRIDEGLDARNRLLTRGL